MKGKTLVLLLLSVLLLSCKKEQQQQTIDVDFGEATFHEPFQGLLSSYPQWLLKTLDWPVLRGLRPDTVCEKRVVEIEFNEEAVRSNSKAELYIAGCDAQNGIVFFCNGERLGEKPYEIAATAEKTEITIECKILPLYNDSVFSSEIYIGGTDLDEVNGVPIHSDSPETMGTWRLDYNRGWSIWWLIWFLMCLLSLLVIAAVLWGLYYVIKFICVFFANHPLSIPSIPSPHRPRDLEKPSSEKSSDDKESSKDKKDNDSKKDSKKKSTKKQETARKHLLAIKPYEKIVYDIEAPCSEREHALEWIASYIEQIDNRGLYNEVYNALKPDLRNALYKLKELWKYGPSKGEKGYWKTSANGRTFVFSDKADSNYEKCKEVGMLECEYSETGIPDFSKATESGTVVDCSDLYDEYTSEQLQKRGGGRTFRSSFQDRAQERIADNKIRAIRAYWEKFHPGEPFNKYNAYYEWRDYNDLVPHEDADCKTMRLVKRAVHKVFLHSGGISRIRVIKDYFD